ncbi:unnamed protein product [Plutella xylostella]|uniref:(diamondback moth) hypothetical protein n=1 Tax=Plutella xylostella TaxID=51655 RepID=A0A8S4FQQ5_PLUXY|nr:unnamed protein product [Plutella xylostella]
MRIKELKRTVNVAWSPAEHHPALLAAGAAAQHVDESFSSTSSLDIYGLNLEDSSMDLELKSSLQTPNKFQKIVWSGAGTIVGGCDNGLLQFYSTEKLLQGSSDALVGSCTKHTGNVSALDINPYQNNLLASGAADSEIFIWDLNNTSQPMAPGSRSQPHDLVQALAWNQQVQHILGSTISNRCVVWDLRKNEPIMKLSDGNSRSTWRALAWHPEVATQVVLAGDTLQLWDLRLAASPLVTLEGHSAGVTSVSWCRQDAALLLSAGQDGRVLCWDPRDTTPGGKLLTSIASGTGYCYSVSWCPRAPALLASCSAEQHVALHSLLQPAPVENTSANQSTIMDSFGGVDSFNQLPAVARAAPAPAPPALPVAPAWLKCHTRAKFAFGGKLVTFGKSAQEEGPQKLVYVSQVCEYSSI